MNHVISFTISFLIIYLVYQILVVRRKKGIEKFKEGKQLEYFKKVFKLDKINIKKFANSLAIANSFIMATTITIIEFIDNLILKMLVGFIVIIPIMLIVYKILGSIYKKKEGK